MGAVKVWMEKATGKIWHYDPETDVTTEVGNVMEGLTSAQIKQRMTDMGLRLR